MRVSIVCVLTLFLLIFFLLVPRALRGLVHPILLACYISLFAKGPLRVGCFGKVRDRRHAVWVFGSESVKAEGTQAPIQSKVFLVSLFSLFLFLFRIHGSSSVL